MRIIYVLFIFLYNKNWASYDPISEILLYIITIYSMLYISMDFYPIHMKLEIQLNHVLCFILYNQWYTKTWIAQWVNVAQ